MENSTSGVGSVDQVRNSQVAILALSRITTRRGIGTCFEARSHSTSVVESASASRKGRYANERTAQNASGSRVTVDLTLGSGAPNSNSIARRFGLDSEQSSAFTTRKPGRAIDSARAKGARANFPKSAWYAAWSEGSTPIPSTLYVSELERRVR